MVAQCRSDCCSSCGSDDVVTDFAAGDVVCRSCGQVLGDQIFDDRPMFDDLNGSGSSRSSNSHRSAGGGGGMADMDRLNSKLNRKLEKKSSKRLMELMDKVADLGDRLGLSRDTIQHGQDLLHKLEQHEKAWNKVSAKSSLHAAVLYKVCRDLKVPRTLEELSTKADSLTKKDIGRAYLTMQKYMVHEVASLAENQTPQVTRGAPATAAVIPNSIPKSIPNTSVLSVVPLGEKIQNESHVAERLIPRFSSQLKLPRELTETAVSIAAAACRLELTTGKKPAVVSATALYMAHLFFPKAKVDSTDIAKEAGVMAASIRICQTQLYPHWRKIIPDNIQKEINEDDLDEILQI